MTPETVAFALAWLATVAACFFVVREYRRHLADARADNRDLRDRMYESKNQPPAGTDMAARFVGRRAALARRRADPTAQRREPDVMAAVSRSLADGENQAFGKTAT